MNYNTSNYFLGTHSSSLETYSTPVVGKYFMTILAGDLDFFKIWQVYPKVCKAVLLVVTQRVLKPKNHNGSVSALITWPSRPGRGSLSKPIRKYVPRCQKIFIVPKISVWKVILMFFTLNFMKLTFIKGLCYLWIWLRTSTGTLESHYTNIEIQKTIEFIYFLAIWGDCKNAKLKNIKILEN